MICVCLGEDLVVSNEINFGFPMLIGRQVQNLNVAYMPIILIKLYPLSVNVDFYCRVQ